MPLPIRVLVVDSSRMSGQAISAALERSRFHVAYAGANATDALTAVEREIVDVALVSTDLGGQQHCGYKLLEKLRVARPEMQVIVLLERSDRDSIVHAFRAGARGVFCRNDSIEVLAKCILRVHEGQVWASSVDVEHLIAALKMPLRLVNANGADLLSRRERDVVQWAAEGLSNREIAGRLGLSENTVKNYLFHVFDKLGISSRVELVLYAVGQLLHVPQTGMSTPFNNEAMTFQWCREAADKFIVAQYALGEMYRDGRGVAHDPEVAYMWFCIAEKLIAAMGCRSSDAKRELQRQLRPEQLESAKRRASDWLEKQGPLLSGDKTVRTA